MIFYIFVVGRHLLKASFLIEIELLKAFYDVLSVSSVAIIEIVLLKPFIEASSLVGIELLKAFYDILSISSIAIIEIVLLKFFIEASFEIVSPRRKESLAISISIYLASLYRILRILAYIRFE